MAYVLGFFAADGTITFTKRKTYFWSINITDKDLLERIRDAVGSSHSISRRVKQSVNHKDLYRLQIGSKQMCEDLMSLGFTTNKANNIGLPKVPKGLFFDFLRGYFDGDGNVWVGHVNKKRDKPTLVIQTAFTSCSESFLFELQQHLMSVGLGEGSLNMLKSTKAYRLQYSTNDSLKLFDFMYNDTCHRNELFLLRKKTKFDDYMKKMQP